MRNYIAREKRDGSTVRNSFSGNILFPGGGSFTPVKELFQVPVNFMVDFVNVIECENEHVGETVQ